jgi:hypothetical protein
VTGSPELEGLAASVRTPRAAGIAGIAFAVIFSAVIILFRSAVPADAGDAGTWLDSDSQRGRVSIALALLPFAGIAFLWFIGVIRDHLGDREDRFFATAFLGSGLLFVALLFMIGAVVASLIAVARDGDVSPDVWRFGRVMVFTLMNSYALRMAAVFTMTATTLAGRLGLIPRWLKIGGVVTALVLLFGVALVPGAELLFPVWVLFVSIQILRANRSGVAGLGPGA